MEATARTSKPRRKIIDIKPETFQALSIMAASHGTNLKNFIEISLDEIVEAHNDAAIYKYLCQTDPQGLVVLNDEEQAAFEKKYGL